jgi:outer membrane protein OmpA-like peptidoglycan-associated protein
VSRITAAAQRIVNNVTGFITRILRAVEAAVRRAVDLVRRGVEAVLNGIRTAINWVKAKISAAIDWAIKKAKALLARALKALLQPVHERALQKVLELIGPAVQSAVAQVKLMFPNGMPAPPEVSQAASQAAQQVPAGPGIIQSLMNPEGDHIGFGITVGGSAAEGVGAQLVGQLMFDVVFDYRRNDIGFFVSPGGGVQGNVLDAGLSAGVGGAASWGTVASFGDPNQDVTQAFGGWFTNVSYGAQGKLAVEGGIQASTGGAFYRGGSYDFSSGGPSYTPFGAGTRPTPGTPGTTTTTPGTPEAHGTVPLGDVHFPTQGDAPDPGQVAAAAAAAHAVTDPIVSIEALGHTSRGWRHLPPGQTREQANQALSQRRGQNVAAQLTPLVAPTPVSGSGAGDSVAAAAGKAETDLSASDQRTSVTAATFRPATPDTTSTTGGTPPGEEPNTFTVHPSIPNPFTSQRTAWGWDTTVGGGALGGAEGAAGLYGGVGVSYSFPVGKTHVEEETMKAIRIAVGEFKMIADVMSISPLGFFRDLMGVMTPVAHEAAPAIGGAATSFSMPTPS